MSEDSFSSLTVDCSYVVVSRKVRILVWELALLLFK